MLAQFSRFLTTARAVRGSSNVYTIIDFKLKIFSLLTPLFSNLKQISQFHQVGISCYLQGHEVDNKISSVPYSREKEVMLRIFLFVLIRVFLC